jgi:hypothetical protein
MCWVNSSKANYSSKAINNNNNNNKFVFIYVRISPDANYKVSTSKEEKTEQ